MHDPVVFIIKGMSFMEHSRFIDESHTWCTEMFGPRTDYRKLFHKGRWENNPERFGPGSSIFAFDDPKDAALFKLKFGDFLDGLRS